MGEARGFSRHVKSSLVVPRRVSPTPWVRCSAYLYHEMLRVDLRYASLTRAGFVISFLTAPDVTVVMCPGPKSHRERVSCVRICEDHLERSDAQRSRGGGPDKLARRSPK